MGFAISKVLVDNASFTLVGGTKRFYVDIRGYREVSVQWVHDSATGSAAINLYGALTPTEEKIKDMTVAPVSGNPFWSAIPTPFTSAPTTAKGSDIGPIGDCPGNWLMVEIVPAADITALSIIVEGKD